MKKIFFLGLIIFTMLNQGCSNDSSEEKVEPAAKTEVEAKEVKKDVLDTKDAMMAKLTEYKITVPEDMVFRSVDKMVYLNKDFEQADSYIIYFDIKYNDQAKKDELLKWYNDQRNILKNDGWTEKTYKQDEEILGGGTYDTSILIKESENCTLDIRITFNETGSSISIHPTYEIR